MSILLSRQTERKKLVVLGLDGLPLSLAKELGKSLPNIGRLAEAATSVQAEIPELSPVNWTSFFTGKGPEDHGTFGFSQMNQDTYELSITNSSHIQCPTIFDRLGEQGVVSRVINLPNTYPVQPIRGMLISGFVSHELKYAAHPPFLASKLSEIDFKLEADTNKGASDLDYLLDELRQTLDSRLKALDMLWSDLSWDLFIHVFTETDRLFHFFMDAVVQKDHPLHFKCIAFLADWDHAIGELLNRYDALPGPKRLMVLADHGFTELRAEICINTWLKSVGLLSLNGIPQNEWDASMISQDTKAFALDPGRIYIHDSRFARGNVATKEKTKLMDEIQTALLNLTLNNEHVIEKVHRGDELYPGSTSNQTPDLVCETKPGFDLKAKFDRHEVFGFHGRTGTHTVHGAIYYDSEGFTPRRMRDTGQAILEYFNLPDDTQ